MIDIPEHLRYKAPKVNVDFSHVKTRYLEPKIPIDSEAYYKLNEYHSIKHKIMYKNQVSSRYLSFHEKKSPDNSDIVSKNKSILETPEYVAHKNFAKKIGITNSKTKYFDPVPIPSLTPRVEVEKRTEENRSKTKLEGCGLFQVGKAREKTFGCSPPVRSVSPRNTNSGNSIVMQWIKNDIPIPGHEEELKPAEKLRRISSPIRVEPFVTRMDGPKKISPFFIKQEKRVEQVAEALRNAKTNSPPRVAFMTTFSRENSIKKSPDPQFKRMDSSQLRNNSPFNREKLSVNRNRSNSLSQCKAVNSVIQRQLNQSRHSPKQNISIVIPIQPENVYSDKEINARKRFVPIAFYTNLGTNQENGNDNFINNINNPNNKYNNNTIVEQEIYPIIDNYQIPFDPVPPPVVKPL